jgi:acyl-CoA oxidase
MGTTGGSLRALLDGEYAEIRDRVRWWQSQPGNGPVLELPREEHREKVLAWARELSSEGDTSRGFPVEYGGEGDVGGAVATFDALAFGDLSLLIKCGVQFGLFGGAVVA